MSHDQLYQRAKEAIDAIFSDTSISQQETINSLETLREEIGIMINSIQHDLDMDKEPSHE